LSKIKINFLRFFFNYNSIYIYYYRTRN